MSSGYSLRHTGLVPVSGHQHRTMSAALLKALALVVLAVAGLLVLVVTT